MAHVDTKVAIIKGYNEEKKLLTESWIASGADVRKEIAERIKQIDLLLAGIGGGISYDTDETE